jgi:hypothetical protein
VQKREYQHNTLEQVRDYLLEALTIVAEIDPPGDLRGLAFSKAVDLVSAKQVIFEQMPAIPNLLPQ